MYGRGDRDSDFKTRVAPQSMEAGRKKGKNGRGDRRYEKIGRPLQADLFDLWYRNPRTPSSLL